MSEPLAWQPSLTDASPSLFSTSFCVLDLETTGVGGESAITEIGAVVVRGGEVIKRFQSLVNPGIRINPMITAITGITNEMVAQAPGIASVLPSFLEFAKNSVWVAHNARFDTGFLKRACAGLGYEWPAPMVLDTLALARRVVSRDEIRNYKLESLARLFRAETSPSHRALADAEATVDVLHGLIGRIGNLGVRDLDDLWEFIHSVSAGRRKKRVWATELPEAPGVYAFLNHKGVPPAHPTSRTIRDDAEVLYVGKSVNLRRRVASYFTASDQRSMIEEMLRIATGCWYLPCQTDLEAQVHEQRIIESRRPRYNRVGKPKTRHYWLNIGTRATDRITISPQPPPDGSVSLGPFTSRSGAESAGLLLTSVLGVRSCSQRIPKTKDAPTCARLELETCVGPCITGLPRIKHAAALAAARRACSVDTGRVVAAGLRQLAALASRDQFEQAADLRDRLNLFVSVVQKSAELESLRSISQLIAAAPSGFGWDVNLIRHGRLIAAKHAPAGIYPPDVATELAATPEAAATPASDRETSLISHWLNRPEVRLLEVTGEWSWPIGVGGLRDLDGLLDDVADSGEN